VVRQLQVQDNSYSITLKKGKIVIKNRQFTYTEFRIIVLAVVLIVAGLLCLYSTFHSRLLLSSESIFHRQLVWLAVGVVSAVVLALVPIHWISQGAYLFYGLSLVLLVVVLFFGSGSVPRWIRIGPLTIQPSEFAKIATILAAAQYLSKEKQRYLSQKQVVVLSIIVFLPLVLILQEPDMGTASVFLALLMIFIVWGGIPFKMAGWLVLFISAFITGFNQMVFIAFLAISLFVLILKKQRFWKSMGILSICLILGLLAPLVWNKMEPYQQHRIFTFLGVHSDPAGAAYQAIQSRIAIGSGGFWGKGFLHGTQTQLRFLPEQHTDFIFSVLGEEFGFLGILLVLVCFGLLFTNILSILKRTRNRFVSFVLVGGLSILFYQVIINMGMTLGLVPVTGLPLPFLSYGGSSLVMALSFVGLVLNIASCRYSH